MSSVASPEQCERDSSRLHTFCKDCLLFLIRIATLDVRQILTTVDGTSLHLLWPRTAISVQQSQGCYAGCEQSFLLSSVAVDEPRILHRNGSRGHCGDPPLKRTGHVMISLLLLVSCLVIRIPSWLKYCKAESVCTAVRLNSALSTSRSLCRPAS